jgi:pimeloyl-ACP methyl ester carboxylesterase
MASTTANDITIEYETAGEPSDPPLLLIWGLGGQLVAWSDAFVGALVAKGFYVIRFDNRDVGKSSWFDDAGAPDVAAVLGGDAQAPYLLADMADDAAGLLDALGIEAAHVLGVSMGGTIAQSLAIGHATKVLTLVSIMSTTGDPTVGQPSPAAIAAVLVPPPADRDAAIESLVRTRKVTGSPGFAFDEDQVRSEAAIAYDRAFHPAGALRQLVAIMASPDRTPGLQDLSIPTLVIHGESDQLVDPSGGKATAAAVPGAELWMVPGMGHDLPSELYEEIASRVAHHCLR